MRCRQQRHNTTMQEKARRPGPPLAAGLMSISEKGVGHCRTGAEWSGTNFPPIPLRMRAQRDSSKGQITWPRFDRGETFACPDSCGNRKCKDRGETHEVYRRFYIPSLATCASYGSARSSPSGIFPACSAIFPSSVRRNVSHLYYT